MAEGTVRGAFDLDTRPAIRAVRDYTREAARGDAQTRQLGASLDRAFGPDVPRRIDRVARSTRELATTTTRARATVESDFRSMTRTVEAETARMGAAVDGLRDRVRALGRETARPHVNITGVTEAIAQVEVLEGRLDRLSRQRATPRVAMGGGFAQNRVGGGFGSAASRARQGAARGAGGMIVGGGGSGVTGAAARAAGGGGGGGSGILSLGSVGFAGLGGSSLAAAAAGALPAVQALTGAAGALGGSLMGAGLGAGVGALAGGGLLAVGLGSILAIAKPATKELQNVMKAQQAVTMAVAQYGERSKQAATARARLHAIERQDPMAGRAVQQMTGFQRDFRRLSAPGRQSYFGLVGDVAQVGRRAAPLLARDANTVMGSVRTQGRNFARSLAGSQTQDTLAVLSSTFAHELPTVERTLENVVSTVEHLVRASLPFFHDANVWVEHWTHGWASSTRDIGHTRDQMRPLVQSFKDWRDLTGAVLGTVRDLFTMGEPAGDSMVVKLTNTFDRWDTWIRDNPQKVRSFFHDTVSSTERMAGALGHVVSFLNQMATALRPLLDRFSQLVGLASSLGLTGTPGALAGVLGAYRGFRGGGGAGGPAARGGGGVLIGGPRAAGAAGRRASGSAAAMEASYLAAPSGYTVRTNAPGGAAAAVDNRSTLLALMAGRPTRPPVGGFDARVRGGLATPEAFAARYGNVEGARYAMPVRVAQRAPGPIRSTAGRLRRAGGGAIRSALPAVAAFAALDAASTQGTLYERFSQGLSSASLGLIPAELPQATLRGQGADAAARFVGQLPQASTPAQARMNIDAIRTQLGSARGSLRHAVAGPLEQPIFGQHHAIRGQVQGTIAALESAQHDETRALQQLTAARHRQLDAMSRDRAAQYGSQLGGAFAAFRRGGQSQQTAANSTTGLIGTHLNRIRDAGVETLGESGLAWARALEKHHPEITGVVDKLTKDITARFKRMGREVHIVNGNILTGSKTEWAGIRDAMSGPIEQAREKLHTDFTSIQQEAVGSLMSMGFSKTQASNIVQGMETGGRAGTTAGVAVNTRGHAAGIGNLTSGAATGALGNIRRQGSKKARGGIFSGSGLMDTVPTPDGGRAAPGEGWIANRHTLEDISRATRLAYGVTAQQMIRGERRQHWRRYARGGDGGGGGGFVAGPGTNFSVGDEPTIAGDLGKLGRRLGVTVTGISGFRSPAHSVAVGGFADDPHTQGRAADIGVPGGFLSSARADAVLRSVGLFRPFYPAQAHEINHVQLLAGGARGAVGAAGLGAGGARRPHVHLRAPAVAQPGVPGALRQRGGAIYAAGLQRKVNHAIDRYNATAGGADLSRFTGGGDARANMALGHRMMLAAGYGEDQWPSLKALWTRESGWSSTITNKSSGAMGIPQALGHGNVFALGDAPAQIGWGLNYIRGRYGSPSRAWAHEQSAGWYARGGGPMSWAGAFEQGGSFVTNGPTAFVAGEGRRRRERVTVTPANDHRRNSTGAGGAGVHIGSISVEVKIDGGNLSDRDLDRVARKVGHKVAAEIVDAIDRGASAGVIG